jgi:hypothetical protein
MDWSAESLYGKARLYAHRAHNESIDSSLFGFWMSLSLELLARAALAHIHPALLADPKEPDNIQYAFGIVPKGVPKSIQAKALFARCSVFIADFTDKMSAHCLIMADRRNSELHTGAAAFEGIDNSAWLPATYEVIEILLRHLKHDFSDFLGDDHDQFAAKMLRDRRATIKSEVHAKLAAARRFYESQTPEWILERIEKIRPAIDGWLKVNQLRRTCMCPVCASAAVMSGESISRSPVRIDEATSTIRREVRVLPNVFGCPVCRLKLDGYQEINEAGLGAIYTVEEEKDPIEYFGIDPEEYVDVEALARDYFAEEYQNE